ncbi:MAG: hypothetical protein ACK559_30700, partial [bacterium]
MAIAYCARLMSWPRMIKQCSSLSSAESRPNSSSGVEAPCTRSKTKYNTLGAHGFEVSSPRIDDGSITGTAAHVGGGGGG